MTNILMMKTVLAVLATLSAVSAGDLRSHPPLVYTTSQELIAYYNYPVETHHVTTDDGYILELHRIPHGINDTFYEGRPVAFIQHCLLCSSADFLMYTPDKALAFMVADAGYDVWLGNFRGNTYSRNHTTLDPDQNEFWQFSWDEMGIHDMPAMIDYVLDTTRLPDLYCIGFSMGTTSFFAMMSEKPQYKEKIRVFAAMAPTAYLAHMRGALAIMSPYSANIDLLTQLLGHEEILPSSNATATFYAKYCDEDALTAPICYAFVYAIGGPDPEILNKEYIPVIYAHTPAGTSYHTVNHYAQLKLSEEFRRYDYGSRSNKHHYGQSSPPAFNLSNVDVDIGLFWGPNDWLATPDDVARLADELPRVVLNHRVDWDKFSHLDFVWSTTAYELVYGYVIDFIAQY